MALFLQQWTTTIIALLILGLLIVGGKGESDSLTEEEQKLIGRLRRVVSKFLPHEYMKTDSYLIRFLRVRNNDLARAKEMLVNLMVWRKDNKIDGILQEDFEDYENEFPFIFDPDLRDKDGRPIIIAQFGILDLRRVALGGQTDRFLRYWTRFLEGAELLLNEIHKDEGNTNLTKAILVVDAGSFNLRQHACVQCIQIFGRLFTMYENNYPDRFHRIYVINAPRAFIPTFELIRPFLAPTTQNAFQIFDHDSDNWKKVLLNEVAPENLPTQYGGTREGKTTTLAELRKTNDIIKRAFEADSKRVEVNN